MSVTSPLSLQKVILLATPVLTIFVLSVFGILPVPLPLEFATTAPLALAGLFFWSVHRPDIIPLPICFALGLFNDLISGGPVGLWAIVFMLVHRFVNTERQILAGRIFVVVWFGFSIVTAASASAFWIVNMIYHMQLLSPIPAFLMAGLGIAIYPLVAWPLSLIRVRME